MRLIILLAACLLAAAVPAAADTEGQLWKSPTCHCCTAWMRHMEGAGFKLEPRHVPAGRLGQISLEAGVPKRLRACHTARIGDYVIEGHVPATDVRRLLGEKPDAIGLSVPGMPVGSPGMEAPDGRREAYEVLLIRRDGSSEVFARH